MTMPMTAGGEFRDATQAVAVPIPIKTHTLLAGGVTSDGFDVTAYGFNRGITLDVELTGGAGASVFRPDAPFALFTQLQLADIGQNAILGPLSGYQWYAAIKYGGYFNGGDMKQSPLYAVTPANGNARFVLHLPLEIRSRDGWGALPNRSTATQTRVTYTIGAAADVYSTAPTTLPTITIRPYLSAWWEPPSVSAAGVPQVTAPPSPGTYHYITATASTNAAAGYYEIPLTRKGYNIRNLIFIQRTIALARTDAAFPDRAVLQYDSAQLDTVDKGYWRHRMFTEFGYANAIDTPGGLDTGVFVRPQMNDFSMTPGNERAKAYLKTSTTMRLEIQGTWSQPNRLEVITDDVNPAPASGPSTATN